MKMKLKLFLPCFAAACLAPFAAAQQTLHNFTAFQALDQTFFVGDWALADPGGDQNPIATFSQGADFYNFTGGSNADTAGALHFFSSNPGDLTGYSLLAVSARLLAGNTASTFTVELFDSLDRKAFAVFSTADFGTSGFTTITTALTLGSFDLTDLSYFRLTGGIAAGTDTLNTAVDHLAAITAIPEPSTYSLLAGTIALLGAVRLHRMRRLV